VKYFFYILLLWAAIIFPQPVLYSHTIELFDGKKYNFNQIELNSDKVLIDNSTELLFSEIKNIDFTDKTIEHSEEKSVSGADKISGKNNDSQIAVIDESIKILEEQADTMKSAHQGVGGVIILDEGWQTVFPDGTSLYKYHFIGKIYNEDYLNWSGINLYYKEGRSKIKIIKARSIDDSGREYSLNMSDVKTLTPSEESQYFDKSGKTVTAKIPGVKVGSIVEYVYEHETYNPFDKHILYGGWFFQDNIPVVKSEYHIIYPKTKKLNILFNNVPEKFKNPARGTLESEFVSESYKMEFVEPVYPEPYMQNINDIKYSMHYAFLEDKNYLYDYIGKMQKERIVPGENVKKFVDSIKTNVSDSKQLMADLFHWIETNIRYVSIKSSISSGWSGHPAEETFINKFGDCTDVSILYTAMLNYAGIEAYPVIINTNDAGELITEIPVPDGNHCIVEIRFDGKIFYVDPTSETYRFPFLRIDDNGVKAVNYIKKEIGYTGIAAPDNNQKISELTMKFNGNGDAKCIIKNSYSGPYEAQIRNSWRNIKKQDTAKVMQDYVSSISPSAVFKNFIISDLIDLNVPTKMEIQFTADNMWENAGDLFIVQIPAIEKNFREIGLEKRKYDICYPSTSRRVNNIKITFPENFEIKYYPDNLNIENEFVKFSGEFKVDGNVIEYNEIFDVKQRVIPASKYSEYKKNLQNISEFAKNRIFVKEK